MYDKYFSATPITIGSQVPKHKGILFSNSNASASGVTFTLWNSSGTTYNTVLYVSPSGSSLLPIGINSLPVALPTGLTAFYVI